MSDPIIWEKYGNYVVSDIAESIKPQVKEFFLRHFVEENLICQMMKYTEGGDYADDHNYFLDHIFSDQASIVIFHNKTNEIVAAAALKPMTKEMRSWTAIRLVSKHKKLNSLLSITRKLILEPSSTLKNYTNSMHLFELCPSPNDNENDTTDWSSELLHGAYRVAQSMKMPILTYIGFTLREQAIATAAGFSEANRIFYPTYTDLDGTRPVPPSDIGELYAVLYYKSVEPFVPHHQMP